MSKVEKPELKSTFVYDDKVLMFNAIYKNQEKILNYIEARFDELSRELAEKGS